MKPDNTIKQTFELFSSSPVKATEKELPVEISSQKQQEYREDLNILYNKLNSPLKLVVMGEVKSGKSTVINAIAGEKVSPANVTETTASIIKIYHSMEGKGSILLENERENFYGSAEEIYDILADNRNNTDFFRHCSQVEIGLPLKSLQEVELVDTPGLETLTEENEETARDFIQKSDVILWILNGKFLGQTDINQTLAETAKFGKPVIGVINRIDEVDSEVSRLIDFVRRNSGIYFEEVFPLSARLALEGRKNNVKEKVKESGISKLMNYLEKNINKKAEEVRDASIISSVKQLVQKEKQLQNFYLEQLDFLFEKIEDQKKVIESHKEQIDRKIENKIDNWVETEFLQEEKENVLEAVNEGRIKFSKILFQNLRKKHIKTNFVELFEELEEDINSSWQDKTEINMLQLVRETKDFISKIKDDYENIDELDDEKLDFNPEDIKNGAKKGGLFGGVWGATMSGLVANVGPQAANICLTGAALSTMPYALSIGVAGGVIKRLFIDSKNKLERERHKFVENKVKELREKSRREVVPKIIDEIQERNKQVADDIIDKFVKQLTGNMDERELRNLRDNIKNYEEELTGFLNELDSSYKGV